MQKLLGSHTFTAIFAVDEQTASTFNGTDGLVPFICTLKMGEKVIGQGRGATVINQMNRFVMRSITFAYHASLIDAVVRATKLMDVFRPDAMPHPWSASDIATEAPAATPKQVEYLTQLIQMNCEGDELEQRMSQLSGLTRSEASEMIESYKR
jgi:hypothetical protein